MTNEKIYVPPIKIQGIKTKLVPEIKKYVAIDDSTIWIEPFMGSGVVGFNIAPENAVFSDINPVIIDFYNGIKNGTITSVIVRNFLECEGKKLQNMGDIYYYEVRSRFNENKDPLDFLFLNRSCFNGMIRFNKNNKFNVPYGHKPERFSKAYITKITNQVKHIEELLKTHNWTFKCQPFNEILSEIPQNSFIYCDPPYIGRNVDYYDSWNENDEFKLCECLKNSDAYFMVSTWDNNKFRKNEYIDRLWNFCNKINIEHFYHIGANEKNRHSMMEALLTNYEIIDNLNKASQEYSQLSFMDFIVS